MHMLRRWIVFGSLLVGSVRSAAVPKPVITPAPNFPTQWLEERQGIDAIELAQVLLTAIPLSLRQIAATNLPAISSILWEQFLDDKKPQWFQELPSNIQSYLIAEFGPHPTWPTAPPTNDGWSGEVTVTATETRLPAAPSTHVVPSWRSETTFITVSTPASSFSSSFASTSTSPSASTSSSPSASHSNTLTTSSSGSPVSTSNPSSPPAGTSGLSRNQKIGLGVGISLGVLGALALIFGCCFLHRRKVAVNGNERPSTPGFIPRFAFHERASTEHFDHSAPLNPAVDQTSYDNERMIWEDDDVETAPTNQTNMYSPTMATHDSSPIMAPALYHTHSSNRARGKRTSYTSLHSVAEVTEPDEEAMVGGQASLKPNPRRSLMLDMPPIPAAATLKRKPVSTSPTEYTPYSPVAEAASQFFVRPPLMENSGSSSSGLVSSQHTSFSSEPGYQPDVSSPGMSPISLRNSGYSYIEEYDPESQGRYIDAQDGLHGGHRSLNTYPEPVPQRNSKTEWPLRNVVGSRHEKRKSPMLDRLYEKRRYYANQ